MIVHDVEQGTDEWLRLRAGLPTASEFSKLVTGTGKASTQVENYAHQLAAEAFAGEPLDRWEGNQWTERGHEMEDRARAWYENTFPERAVTRVGFITDDLAGASPDSLVDDDGLLEIKCLKASNHVGVIMYYERMKKLKPDYVAQTQGQIKIAARDWCDILFWHPDLPALLLRQRPDEQFRTMLTAQLVKCIELRDNALKVMQAL